MDLTRTQHTREHTRLRENQARTGHWNRWGPYLSERAWGTVREDYSPFGTAWDYFPHDHGRGCGASHQTGWTALVAKLLQQSGEPFAVAESPWSSWRAAQPRPGRTGSLYDFAQSSGVNQTSCKEG